MKSSPSETVAQRTARVFGCTIEQAQLQVDKNLRQLRDMLAVAVATGRKVNGNTADQIRGMIAKLST